MDTGRHLESPTDKRYGASHHGQQILNSVKSTANYINSQISSPSAAGTIGRQRHVTRAASSDTQQISEKHRIMNASGKFMNSEKKGGKRASSHLRNFNQKDTLIASGALKYAQSKQLAEDGFYSIFTTRNPSRFVVVNDQPFIGKTLNELFSEIEDIKQLQACQQN